MEKTFLTLILCSLCPLFIFGQGESNNWYFGYQVGLHFNADGSVTSFNDSAMNAPEGSATVSDASGKLLFYTDGQTIYDRTHEIMQNGTGLITNPTGTQTALIVPKPEDENILYVFSVDATTGNMRGMGLNYSEVDMRLNNGNGAVVQKNINLLEDCAEKITSVIKDCATKSIWIVTQATETGVRLASPRPFASFNTLHAFEVTPLGVNNISVKSTFNTISILDDRGYIKISPDKTKLASANMRDGLYVYDFDVNSGIFSNQQNVQVSSANQSPYGVEFSTNSQYLYVHASNDRADIVGHTSDLVQFNLQAPNINGSQVLLDTSGIYRGALQMASNGKIYRALSLNFETGIPFLGVINNPDMAGVLANYEHNGLALNSGISSVGLPPFVPSFFTTVDLVEEDAVVLADSLRVCEGAPLVLEAQPIPSANYAWEKDGSPISGLTTNTYTVADALSADSGLYKVTITKPGSEACPIEGEIMVAVEDVPEASSIALTSCDTDDNLIDGITMVNLESIESVGLTYTIYESEEDRNIDKPILNPMVYINIVPFEQTLFYRVENAWGCNSTGEINLKIIEPPSLALDDTYTLCLDNPNLTIDAPEDYEFYQWRKVEGADEEVLSTEQSVDITEVGNYILEVRSVFMTDDLMTDCMATTTFTVQSSSSAIIDGINITGSGDQKTLEIEVSGEGSYEYSMDGSIFQDSNIFENLVPGIFTFFINDKEGCGLVEKTIEVEEDLPIGGFPKFFTPNADGINDYWQFIPPENGEINVRTIFIFNRQGQLIIQIDPTLQGWNGIVNGKRQPSTDYWFKAISLDRDEIIGHFTLKR